MPKMIRHHVAIGPRHSQAAESLSEIYHENSRLRRIHDLPSPGQPDFTPAELRAMAAAYKQYQMHSHFTLPGPDLWPPANLDFDGVIALRRSVRSFDDSPISLAELAKILHGSYGITGALRHSNNISRPLRAAPSAGALYPAEIYVGARRVEGLDTGMYHYNVPRHALALLTSGDPTQAIYGALCEQEMVRCASVVVLIAAVMGRTKRKYGERGYRYLFLDVGHLAENMCLGAAALGLGAVTTGGFYDDEANALLRLDGVEEAVLYCALIGNPASEGPESHDQRSRPFD